MCNTHSRNDRTGTGRGQLSPGGWVRQHTAASGGGKQGSTHLLAPTHAAGTQQQGLPASALHGRHVPEASF